MTKQERDAARERCEAGMKRITSLPSCETGARNWSNANKTDGLLGKDVNCADLLKALDALERCVEMLKRCHNIISDLNDGPPFNGEAVSDACVERGRLEVEKFLSHDLKQLLEELA